MKRVLCIAIALGTAALFPTAASTQTGNEDTASGGGQLAFECTNSIEYVSVAVNAHVPAGTPTVSGGAAQPGAGGTFSLTIPKKTATRCSSFAGLNQESQLVAAVDCMELSPDNWALITGHVTRGTGRYAGTAGRDVYIDAVDQNYDGYNTYDIFGFPSFEDVTEPCAFGSTPQNPLARGNVIVSAGD
jgi:hypothetical protein